MSTLEIPRLTAIHTVTQSNTMVNAILGQASSFHWPPQLQIHQF